MLTVIETHPIQYHAPVYRALQHQFGVAVTAVYGSDFSVVGYRDQEFGTTFAWDTDLLAGYTAHFLHRTEGGGPRSDADVPTRGLRQLLLKLRPNAIMLVGYSPRFHQVAFLHALATAKPILLRAETTDHAVKRGNVKYWVRDWALRCLYSRCARLLYVGHYSHRHFQRLGCPDQRLVFSPYCVDTSAFALDEESRRQLRSSTRRALGIGPEDRVVLLSGKLARRKRPDLLLHAIRRLPQHQRERMHVLALGSGDQQSTIEALASETPPIRVTFLGFQNQSRLSAYYHASDVLVLPSESNETWGLVVNEALHHGLPCVVSDAVGSAPDLIEPGVTGEVFQSGSAVALADALQRVWPLLTSSSVRAACHRAISSYTVEKAAEGIALAYEAVARGA